MKCLSLLRRVGVRPLPLPLHLSHSSQSSPSPEPVTVTLIPGDGVGPELMDSCQEVLRAMGARLHFEEVFFSEVRWRRGEGRETKNWEKNVLDKPRSQSTSGGSDGFCDEEQGLFEGRHWYPRGKLSVIFPA